MNRILVASDVLLSDFPTLSKESAQHLRAVRPEEGEVVELFDGAGSYRHYAWHRTSGLNSVGERTQEFRNLVCPLTLFACITKGSRWDWTLEKATELGVDRIVPVISERTIVRIPKNERTEKRDRYLRIVESAVTQCHSLWLPEVLVPMDFADSLALVKKTQCLIGALTDPPSPHIFSALSSISCDNSLGLATYIGPEGDFTPSELSALMEIATPVSFGPQILRAETAAIYALSLLTASRCRC